MSIYSRALNDSPLARLIFKLDQNEYTALEGTQSAGTTVDVTGTTPTFSTQSCSGGTGSFIFDTTQGLSVLDCNPINITSGSHSIEAVFRTTYSGSTQKYIWRIPSGGFLVMQSGTLRYASGNGTYTTTITTTGTYNDDVWHHVVCNRYSADKIQIWVDGTKVVEANTFYGSFPNADDIYIGQSNLAGDDDNWDGYIDFVATYGTSLTDQEIADRYADFDAARFLLNSVVVTADVSTASALIVDSTSSAEVILTADPATASATFPEAEQSDLDPINTVQSYMMANTSLFEQYYRFGPIYKGGNNFGTGGQGGIFYSGSADNDVTGGIQFSGAIVITGSGNDGSVTLGEPAVVPELTDGSYVIGHWIKFPGLLNDNRNVFAAYTNQGQGCRADYNDGQIQFRVDNSNGSHTIQTNTPRIDDGNWHFIVYKVDNGTMEAWVDNQLGATGTFNGQHPDAMNALTFAGNFIGNKNTTFNISQFFIGTHANLTTQILTNIYNAGSQQIDANASMPNAVTKFNSAYNDKAESFVPEIDHRLEEGQNAFQFTDVANSTTAYFRGNPEYMTTGVLAKNNKGVRFTNIDSFIQGNYSALGGTFSSANVQTLSILFKTASVANGEWDRLGSTALEQNVGLTLSLTEQGNPILYSLSFQYGWRELIGSGNLIDNQWHHIVAVKNGSTVNLYVDGVLNATTSESWDIPVSDSLNYAIGGVQWGAYGFYQNNYSRDTTIDEFAIFPAALTAQQVTELYQSIALTMGTTASATFPDAIASAGTEANVAAAKMLGLAEMNHPQQFGPAMIAFATFVMPNYYAETIINTTYYAEQFTASALFHDPQFSVGEINSADHMDASALMVQPLAWTPGRVSPSVIVAGDAIFVDPGVITVLGAQHFAKPMESRATFILPPAYFSLLDDPWYIRLYAQHAEQNIEPRFVTSSLSTEARTQVAKTILKFFDDVTDPITVGSGRYLENDLENKVFLTPDSTDTSKIKIYPTIAPNLTPTPTLDRGYFDTYGRQAVRVQNIEFAMPEEIYNSQLPFSLEFSIKTTKANQIIAKGQWRSFLAYQRSETGFGLFNGKLYLMDVNTTSGTVGNRTPHPLNPDVGGTKYAFIGNKNIADGNWHHIIVQYGYNDNRIQFWVDGQLDRQLIGSNRLSRLYIMGSNNANTNYQSDFETSGWSYDKQAFIEEQDVTLNSAAYVKYEPIKAEVATATVTMTANNSATGNRGRALMLYWWPEDSTINPGAFSGSRPQEGGVTFDPGLSTDDFLRRPPQEYYGWDVYPVDITGRYVSELVNKEAYGEENIIIRSLPFTIIGEQQTPANTEYLVNANGHFVDPITDARRYIDLVKDIDLTQFDCILFKNYPEQSTERDSYTREEFADEYFNLRENTLFDNFIKSLRAALDTGISLYITNAELAVDLGIIDRYEDVSIMHEGDFEVNTTLGDQYLNTIFGTTDAIGRRDDGWYPDLHKNNRLRVVNTLPELTDDPYYIWTDWAYFANDSQINFGGSDRPYIRSEYKPNGLQVGDTFLISNPTLYDRSPFQAVPFANIKSGKVITAFANTVLSAGTAIENPYKNHATTIILEPGDKVMGEPIASKIFINFTERLYFPYSKSLGLTKENQLLELIQDEHINRAYEEGSITLEKRDELLASSDNLDRRLEAAIANNDQALIDVINVEKYWTLNGDNLVVSRSFFDDPTAQRLKDGLGKGVRGEAVNRINKKGALSTKTVYSELPWFTIETGWEYETIMVNTPSMLTRGFRWLSNRTEDVGTVLRVDSMTAIATGLPMPLVVADTDRTVYAQPAFANAKIVDGTGYIPNEVSISTLPLFAEAKFGDFVKNIIPDVFTATAVFRQDVRTLGIQEDEIVVYINHVDPILYLREEVIK